MTMSLAQNIEFDSLMEPVALKLLGEPGQRNGTDWRYGTRGSLSVNIAKGQWFDHEANEGGGVIDLIKRQGHPHPATWLRSAGLLGASPHVIAHSKPKSAKTYDYRDERGELLYQVVRTEPKVFRQRRPDGRGGWDWRLGDVRRVPYRLPELIKAVADSETVYIPEGEKDVDNLRAIGLAATTNSGGVKKWRPEYSEHFRGADVVVLPDNDEAGREHGNLIAASLRGSAKRIRVLDIGKLWPGCPPKGDISDWLKSGGSVEKLKEGLSEDETAAADNQQSQPASVEQNSHFAEPVWPVMHGAAYHGLAGEVVHTIEPHSEADPVAILLQFLAAFGNAVGPAPYYQVAISIEPSSLS
jgi:putative DNA primase/helicase